MKMPEHLMKWDNFAIIPEDRAQKVLLFSLSTEIKKEDSLLSDSPKTKFICTNSIKIEPEETYLVLTVSTLLFETRGIYMPSEEVEGMEYYAKKKELVERFDFLWVYGKNDEQYAYRAESILGERIWTVNDSLPKRAIDAKYAHPMQIAIPDEKGRMVRVGTHFLTGAGSNQPLIMRGMGITKEKALQIVKEKERES